MTRKKVLCMEFIHGAKITDVPKLDQMGINKREVAQLLHELFCEQIFVHGFIHRYVQSTRPRSGTSNHNNGVLHATVTHTQATS
jgi:hypothetical protein